MDTIRLTTAQALVKFLNQQYVDFGNGPERFVHGIFTVFGHGNVLGLGQALQEAPGEMTVYQGGMSKEWCMRRLPLPSRAADGESWPAPLR